jgi:hypothetical protein
LDWEKIETSNVIGPYEGDLKLGVPVHVNIIVRFRVDNTENKMLVLIRDQDFLEFGVTAPVIGTSKMYQGCRKK